MSTQYTEDFKRDAVTYWKEHQELGISKCAKNLGIGKSTLSTWVKIFEQNNGSVIPERKILSNSSTSSESSALQSLQPQYPSLFSAS